MSYAFTDLSLQLHDIAASGLYRSRRVIDSPQGIHLKLEGRSILNFCSNDYLGLANHPEVISAFKSSVDQYGVGSGSAHLICGHSSAHHALEEALADFTGRDRALLFSTGYMANMGVISALLDKQDAVFEDRLNHASLLDGGLMSGARFKRYHHADIQHLNSHLNNAAGNKLIVTDGVFSMDGDFAPLADLSKVAKAHDAWLMVDDAHGFGVLGEKGAGLVECVGLSQADLPILMGTLGKGFGTFGAFIAGSDELIETLIQKARTYIFTTALPAAVADATSASLKRVIADNWRREHLKNLALRFRTGAEQLGFELVNPVSANTDVKDDMLSAIQPIVIGDSQRTVAISEHLLKAGYLVSAIRPPTVPKGSARLRVTFSALHQEQQVDQLLDALNTAINQTPLDAD